VRAGDGLIQIPTSTETSDGGLTHGTQVIDQDDPRYAAYDRWLTEQEEQTGASAD
jgi:hypothetical protein